MLLFSPETVWFEAEMEKPRFYGVQIALSVLFDSSKTLILHSF